MPYLLIKPRVFFIKQIKNRGELQLFQAVALIYKGIEPIWTNFP